MGDLMLSSVNGSSPMADFRFCFRLLNDSVRYSWMRIDRLAILLPSLFVFGCRVSELLSRVLSLSNSDSDVFEVNESVDVELRSFDV